MENNSSDSLEGLSVSAFGTGVVTNDLTNDSQGTYCELGENSQHLESQDLFGSQTSSVSSVLECSNPDMKRQSQNDFSIITTASTPLTKRSKKATKKEDGSSTSGDGKSSPKSKKISTDLSDVETTASSLQPQQNNTTILISSASGDHSHLMGLSQTDTQLKIPTSGSDELTSLSQIDTELKLPGNTSDDQLNLSQLDTQLKLPNDVDELGEDPQLPASLSSIHGLNHTSDLHNMSTNSYNSHQIRATNLTERWGNKKVVSKCYSVNCVATIREVRCESTNQVLSLQLSELSFVQPHTNVGSPFGSKSRLVQREASPHPVQCVNCHYEFKAPLPPPVSTPDLVSSGPENISSSLCEDELNKTDNQLNFPPPQASAPLQRKHGPVLPPDKQDEPLLSKSDEEDSKKMTSSSPTHKTMTSYSPTHKTMTSYSPAQKTMTSSSPAHKTMTSSSPTSRGQSASKGAACAPIPFPIPPIPILQATRRSSFTKKFVALERIKEEAKPAPPASVTKSAASLTPKSSMKKKRGRQKRKIKTKDIEEEEEEEMRKSVGEEEEKRLGEGNEKKAIKEDKQNEAKQASNPSEAGKPRSRVRRELIPNRRKQVLSPNGKQDVGATASNVVKETTRPNAPDVLAANVYDPGKLVLAIWMDKVYYPAVIQEDLASFLRVKYLDGFVKKIIKQQTVPLSVLIEDTPVHVNTEEDDNLRPAKLKAFDEVQRVCTVEWTGGAASGAEITSVGFEYLRMFPEHVRAIQNKYTHLLETPKLHQLTLDNVLQRKRTPARRRDGAESDLSSYSCASSSQSSSRSHASSGSGGVNSSHSALSSSKRTKRSAASDDQSAGSPSSHSEMPSRARPSASIESASKCRKNVLEEKVDNSGNRGGGAKTRTCMKRIFSKDNAKGSTSTGAAGPKLKTPVKSSGSPPAKRRRKSKGASSGGCDAVLPQPSCSKQPAVDTENAFRPTSHVDIDVTEYCPSSDSEYELHSIDMGGYDIEFVESESDQQGRDCVGDLETGSSRALDKRCGPIPGPGHDLFTGYVFVVSHAGAGAAGCESDGNLSDQQYAELSTKFPFRRRRLEIQLTKGGGTVYPSLNLVPHEKLDNTLLVTDRPSTTCNFILALAMRVPVLHYYYVIQCCITKSHIRKHRLPEMCSGYSLEEKCLHDRNLTSANILGEYFIVVAMSAKSHALVFWEKVLKFAGASVKQWQPGYNWDGLASISSCMTVAILVDDDVPEEVLAQPYPRILPVWIIQSLIHAQARDFDAHPAYTSSLTALQADRSDINTSETY